MAENSYQQLDITVDPNDIETGARQILAILRPGWEAKDIEIKALTGGYSNSIVRCRIGSDSEGADELAVRVNGAGAGEIVDHDAELLSARIMATAGVGTPVYCTFKSGFVYRFIRGEPFKAEVNFDEPSARLLMRKAVQIHAVDVDGILEKLNSLDGNMNCKLDKHPRLFKTLHALLNICPETLTKMDKNEKYLHILDTKKETLKELAFLEEQIKTQNMPVVFSHGDWRNENVIYNKDDGSVTGIDLEYTAMDYEPYDIAHYFMIGTFFNPFALSIDWFPTKEQELLWVRVYLEERAKHRGVDPKTISMDEVQTWHAWTRKLCLAALQFLHLYTWIQEANSPLPVDFLRWSHLFREAYFARKREIFGA